MGAIRKGPFLVNWHRREVRRFILPSLQRYQRGWWSFI